MDKGRLLEDSSRWKPFTIFRERLMRGAREFSQSVRELRSTLVYIYISISMGKCKV